MSKRFAIIMIRLPFSNCQVNFLANVNFLAYFQHQKFRIQPRTTQKIRTFCPDNLEFYLDLLYSVLFEDVRISG